MFLLIWDDNRLGLDVISGYVGLDLESQSRNVAAWTPVVAEVLHGFSIFEKESVSGEES